MQADVRIEQRERGAPPSIQRFSEVFITQDGRTFYTRLFHQLDNSPHARAAQLQDFVRRQRQEMS